MKSAAPLFRILLLGLLGVLLAGAPVRADDPAPSPPPPKKAAPKPPPKKAAPKPPPKKAAPKAPPKKQAPEPAAPGVEEEPEEEPPRLEFPDDGLVLRANGDIVYFYRTNFVTPGELQQGLAKLLGIPADVVKLQAFDKQNILLFEGDPDEVELAVEAAAYFDVAAPQVFIEAKVVEITYESNFEFGLDYIWSRAQVGPESIWQGVDGYLAPPAFTASQAPGGLPFQGTSLLFGFLGKNAEQFGLADIALRAMEVDGKAEVLSKPSIIVTQNIPAEVVTSESRQINTYDKADKNNAWYKGVPLKTGVSLKVKATHIGESFITLEIEPEVMGVQGLSATTGGTLTPVQTLRRAKTTVTLGDQETLVIGGLYTNSTVKDHAKTPLLSDIPVLGYLFTRTRDTKVKTELVFMLTPTIVRKTSDFKVIAPPSELERLEGVDEEGEAPCSPPAPPGTYGPTPVRSTPLASPRPPKTPCRPPSGVPGRSYPPPPPPPPLDPPPPRVRSAPGPAR